MQANTGRERLIRTWLIQVPLNSKLPYLARIYRLKCTVNSNMVNSKFQYFVLTVV